MMLKSVLSAALVFGADRAALVLGAALAGESSQATPGASVESCLLLQTRAAHETKEKVELHEKPDTCLDALRIKVPACATDAMLEALEVEMADATLCKDVEPSAELAAHLGGSSSDLDSMVRELCNTSNAEGAFPFESITGKGNQFDKSYFDGGTFLNGEVQTDAGEHNLQKEGEFIGRIYEKAQHVPFSWPDMPNFEECALRAAMCCFVADRQALDNNGNCGTPYDENCVDADPGDNTDVCLVDLGASPTASGVGGGLAVFPGDEEGPVHCHGFAWSSDELDVSSRYKGNKLFYTSFYDHLYSRGYVRNVPGAPMCGCVEQMPVVSRADCTEVEVEELWEIASGPEGVRASLLSADLEFSRCQGSNNRRDDLRAHYETLAHDPKELEALQERLVGNGNCVDAIAGAL